MAKVRIELLNKKDEVIVYEEQKVMGSAIREGIKAMKKINAEDADLGVQLDAYLEFATYIFRSHKLTQDQILDGLESEKVVPTLNNILGQVMGFEKEPDPEAKK